MWKRKDLKQKAKKVLKRNYWTAVIVCFIISLVTSEYGMSTMSMERNFESSDIRSEVDNDEYSQIKEEFKKALGEMETEQGTQQEDEKTQETYDGITESINSTVNSIMKSKKYIYKITDGVRLFLRERKVEAIVLFVGGCIAFLFIVFIADPLLVGERRFFLKIKRSTKTKISQIATIFKKDQWFNIAKIMLIRNIYTFLWYLTIIGGFIKTYEYVMIPYILADNPHVKTKEAFKLSKQMMKGNKFKAFVLDLSFFLWYMLSALTLGLAGILYVNPYTTATRTELYLHLKRKAIKEKYEYYEILVKEKEKKEIKEAE